MNRLAYVDALVGVTAEDLARDVDAASTPDELYTAVRSALHLYGPGVMAEQPEDTNPVNLKTVKSFQYSYAWQDQADYEPDLSQRLGRLADAAGQSIEAFSDDLLLADAGRAIFYQPGAN